MGALSVAWVYPNSYSVAMASLGYQIVRTQIRDLGFTRIERSFAEPMNGANTGEWNQSQCV